MKTKSFAALVVCVGISGLPHVSAEENINPASPKNDGAKNGEAPDSSQPANSIVMPTGTAFSVNLTHALDLSKVAGQTNFIGTLAHPIYQRERVLIPGGTEVQGRIAPPQDQSTQVPELIITQMTIDGHPVPMKTEPVDATGTRQSLALGGGKPPYIKRNNDNDAFMRIPKDSMIEFRLSEPVTFIK